MALVQIEMVIADSFLLNVVKIEGERLLRKGKKDQPKAAVGNKESTCFY